MADIIPYTLLGWLMVIATTAVAAHEVTTATLNSCKPDFINTSCSTTRDPSVCYQYLSPYASEVECDPKKLCSTALNVSIQPAQKTSSLVYKWYNSKGLAEIETKLLKDCIDLIDDSIVRLNQSVKVLENISSSSRLDDVKTWVSAAMTNYNTCVDGFQAFYVNQNMNNEIRLSGFEAYRVTEIALSFINKLKS